MTPGDREAGFTLVEALVSLVLGAMVLAAVLSTVRVAAGVLSRARDTVADAEGFARAGTILAGDAAHALWIGDEEGRPLFVGLAAEVDLPMVPRPAVPGGASDAVQADRPPVAVVYRIVPGQGGALVTRAEAAMTGGRIGLPGAAVPLWQARGRLEFRFLDDQGRWLRDWPDPRALPRALAVADPALGVPQLVAALPDLVAQACAQGPGPACPLPFEVFP